MPMTIAMRAGHELLPDWQRYPLAPRKITTKLAKTAGLEPSSEHDKYVMTIIAHYLYGATLGSLFAGLVPPEYQTVKGASGYGLAIWGANYLGLLPAMGIHHSATKTPLHRNLLMIGAHIVWGTSLGMLLEMIEKGKRTDSDVRHT
ncbi:DUF1440 domain-containing protein [bacterium]|nr:DUF1440 domain-containing protein [bacterium]